MRTRPFLCLAILAALPASAQETGSGIELIAGHPIHHESAQEAGVAMALSITPDRDRFSDLMALCEELRIAAGLADQREGLRLETIFVVPRKAMAVEGYYWPRDSSLARSALVPGEGVARATLDPIVARAGIPPRILDEAGVEHEISCSTIEPLWNVAWYDVRPLDGDDPGTVIERARLRFTAIYQSVVEHGAGQQRTEQAHRTLDDG